MAPEHPRSPAGVVGLRGVARIDLAFILRCADGFQRIPQGPGRDPQAGA